MYIYIYIYTHIDIHVCVPSIVPLPQFALVRTVRQWLYTMAPLLSVQESAFGEDPQSAQRPIQLLAGVAKGWKEEWLLW